MDTYAIAMTAAFACAICNGTAAVLQKISADKENNTNSLDVGLLWKLAQDKPYIIGLTLDLVGWVLTLIAVHYLPLFLVEAILAFALVVTALIERLFRHQHISIRSYMMIGVIVLGLVLLIIASSSQFAKPISDLVRYLIVFSPIPIVIASYFFAGSKKYLSAIILAVLSGIAFGGTSTAGRIFNFSKPYWNALYNPITLTIIISGILGLLLFSIALQRAKATTVNAAMTTSQVVVPTIIGVLFFGDSARNGMWYLVILGIILAIVGVTFLSLDQRVSD